MRILWHFWAISDRPGGPRGQFWWVQIAPTDHPWCIPPRSNHLTKFHQKITQNDPRGPKNDPKWSKNGPKITFWCLGYLPGTEIVKKCIPLSSTFDVEAPFQRYLRKSEIWPILGRGRLRRASTLIFQNFSMKLGQIVRVTKKMTLTYNRGEP